MHDLLHRDRSVCDELLVMAAPEWGICPVCNGTTRQPAPEGYRKFGAEYGWYGFDKADGTIDCRNCGAQTMSGTPTGKVTLRPDGTPCKHNERGEVIGRGLYLYRCQHCDWRYQIDSGD